MTDAERIEKAIDCPEFEESLDWHEYIGPQIRDSWLLLSREMRRALILNAENLLLHKTESWEWL